MHLAADGHSRVDPRDAAMMLEARRASAVGVLKRGGLAPGSVAQEEDAGHERDQGSLRNRCCGGPWRIE